MSGRLPYTTEGATSGNFSGATFVNDSLPRDFRMVFISNSTITCLQDDPITNSHQVSKHSIGMIDDAADFILGNWSSLVLVLPDKMTIFAFGGFFERDGESACGRLWPRGPHNHVVKCYLEDLTVEEQAPMLHARFAPGVVQASDCIYVFGGGAEQDFARTLCHSEQYSLQINTWTAIQPLPAPKRCFNPAIYQRSIYLLGGWGTSHSYSYDIPTDQYTQLAFSLPATGMPGPTLIDNSKVLFIAKGKRYVFRREPFQLEAEIDDASITVSPRSSVAPNQCGEYVYFTAVLKTESKFERYFSRYSYRQQEYTLIASYENTHDQLR